jgi:hypothetical protein
LVLERPVRIVRPVVKVTKLPPLTIALRFPVGSLLDRINAVVPRHLARDHRDDVIGEMGLLEETDIDLTGTAIANVRVRPPQSAAFLFIHQSHPKDRPRHHHAVGS